ncbi:hypothetical protein R75461_08345 [Paraburkholderia nemoris]|nr:hypothetical protein R75461_08345 [Paraburkholderia nemoris]
MANHPYARRSLPRNRKPATAASNDHEPETQSLNSSPDSERQAEIERHETPGPGERHETPEPEWKAHRRHRS